MSSRERLFAALAGLILVVMYFVPMWRIELEAPQYPEGLGLHIMIDDVQGMNEFDLRKINQLNHYIGMKTIVPEAIPELKIMPWLIGLMIVMGLATAATGSRTMLTIWTVSFVVILLIGLVDFWLWEYDYGHNLDLEHAAIKVPGMSYQPPLIGSKQLLNFKAHSWPHIGGIIAILSCFTAMLLWWKGRKSTINKSAAAVIAALLLAGCATGPEAFHFGEDRCEHCRMTIADPRFAAQAVLETGRAVKFDGIECMTTWLQANEAASLVQETWVSDGNGTGTLIAAAEATFAHDDAIRSPMGAGLIAFADEAAARDAVGSPAISLLDWNAVQALTPLS